VARWADFRGAVKGPFITILPFSQKAAISFSSNTTVPVRHETFNSCPFRYRQAIKLLGIVYS
jgi:hypothetical protein